MQGDTNRIRKFLHGEHAGCYAYNHGNHYVTDGCYKYNMVFPNGDISREPDAETKMQPWRNRMIEFLKDRPEGFTDGTTLIPGQSHDELLPDYDPEATYPYL